MVAACGGGLRRRPAAVACGGLRRPAAACGHRFIYCGMYRS